MLLSLQAVQKEKKKFEVFAVTKVCFFFFFFVRLCPVMQDGAQGHRKVRPSCGAAGHGQRAWL